MSPEFSPNSLDNDSEFVGRFGIRSMTDDLLYMRNRFYSPSTGHFYSEDPIGLGGGDVSFYRYVLNDPVNFVDPYGLFVFGYGVGGGAGIGGLTSDGIYSGGTVMRYSGTSRENCGNKKGFAASFDRAFPSDKDKGVLGVFAGIGGFLTIGLNADIEDIEGKSEIHGFNFFLFNVEYSTSGLVNIGVWSRGIGFGYYNLESDTATFTTASYPSFCDD